MYLNCRRIFFFVTIFKLLIIWFLLNYWLRQIFNHHKKCSLNAGFLNDKSVYTERFLSLQGILHQFCLKNGILKLHKIGIFFSDRFWQRFFPLILSFCRTSLSLFYLILAFLNLQRFILCLQVSRFLHFLIVYFFFNSEFFIQVLAFLLLILLMIFSLFAIILGINNLRVIFYLSWNSLDIFEQKSVKHQHQITLQRLMISRIVNNLVQKLLK